MKLMPGKAMMDGSESLVVYNKTTKECHGSLLLLQMVVDIMTRVKHFCLDQPTMAVVLRDLRCKAGSDNRKIAEPASDTLRMFQDKVLFPVNNGCFDVDAENGFPIDRTWHNIINGAIFFVSCVCARVNSMTCVCV